MTPDARRRLALGTAVVAGISYLVLAVLVATGATQHIDDTVRQWFRPHDTWGMAQVTTGPLIDALEPRRVFVLLALVGIGVAIRRASWRPLAYTGVVALSASILTLVTKFALHRPDPHSDMFAGGSFPSGHMLADLICLGCAALVLRSRTRWWTWTLVGVVEASMGAALLFAAAHWFTDVLGGVILAVAVLAAASTLPLRSPLGNRRSGTTGQFD